MLNTCCAFSDMVHALALYKDKTSFYQPCFRVAKAVTPPQYNPRVIISWVLIQQHFIHEHLLEQAPPPGPVCCYEEVGT